uniref:Queuosine precursor transporter n=1 Tax=Hemiselmis andersenii TaxID=464988 RepID=A0A6U5ACB7_HEMAN|mmetsp:Transcript_23241/g.53970  ORF Transcript_23241/g.53970 Transcript_23241/m.53970 type:complete len:318 (+) Transcript_23241:210-1163(+)
MPRTRALLLTILLPILFASPVVGFRLYRPVLRNAGRPKASVARPTPAPLRLTAQQPRAPPDQKAVIGTEDAVEARVGPQYELSAQQGVYMWLSGLFVACLLIADIIGVKLFEVTLPFEVLGFKTVQHTCGMLTFPITFIIGDMINEYFGEKAAKRTVYMGFAMSSLTFIVINVAQGLPSLNAPFNVSQSAFDQIFGSSKMLYVASLIAFMVGNLADIWLFTELKKRTNGKALWLRATGSTVLSQMIDSLIVTYLAFGLGKTLTGQVGASFSEVLQIAATGYGLKFVLALSVTPIMYLSRGFLHQRYGLEPIPPDELD